MRRQQIRRCQKIIPLLFVMLSSASCYAACIIAENDSIAFLGDSITQQGAGAFGYVRLVESALKVNGVPVKVIPAGISGHKSNQMLARLEKDVLSKKPTWMTLSCGVNDVWHGKRGVNLEDYTKNISEIVDRAQKAGIKVVVLTSTMIREDKNNKENAILDTYNEALKAIAAEKECLLVDLNKVMKATVERMRGANSKKGNQLTRDGVHMNADGNIMMATEILKIFGFDDAMLQLADAAWVKTVKCRNRIDIELGLSENRALVKIAAEQQKSLNQIATELFKKFIEENKLTPALVEKK